jgi:hypothetical protein
MDEKLRLKMIFNMKKIFETELDNGVEAIVRAVFGKRLEEKERMQVL